MNAANKKGIIFFDIFFEAYHYSKRVFGFSRRCIDARIRKHTRMEGHPQTHGNKLKGLYVNTPYFWATFKLEKLKRQIRMMADEFRCEALALGPFYEGRDGLEQLNSLGLHGLRYWFVSQLVKNYASTQCRPNGEAFSTLEIGCNTGWTSLLIKSECKDLDVTAMDIDPRFVQLGQVLEKALGFGGIRWVAGNGLQLSDNLEGEVFDLILLCEILEHFGSRQEQKKILSQAVKVCRPGGKIVVSVPFEDRIPVPGEHLTEFDASLLTELVEPFADDLVWLMEERMRYILDRPFFLIFTPKNANLNNNRIMQQHQSQ